MFKISDLFKKSNEISTLLPNLISDSALLNRNIVQGLHSARFAGKGEDFWQFREYKKDDNISSIDWRKSASLDKILVKEKENETSRFVYFHFDKTKSMLFKSSKKFKSKYYISVLTTLTLSRIFLRNRENIYHFKNQGNPVKCSQDLSSFDKSFLFEEQTVNFPKTSLIRDNSSVFVFSDFFYDIKHLKVFMSKLKKKNVDVYVFQVLDPMETNLNLREYSLLNDMENNSEIIIGDSKIYRDHYKQRLINLQKDLKELCQNYNWHFLIYKTSDELKPFILKIINKITLKKN